MIDLHCHILPGVDDGAKDLETSLDMARASVADGVTVVACTPHIMPGVFGNTGPAIREAMSALQSQLARHEIGLRLVTGSDAHLVPNMVAEVRSGQILTLADTRYILVEPPHHVPPLRLEGAFFELMIAGYVPILTHPERLHWIEQHYASIVKLFDNGVWMQITAGSLTGAFGAKPLYWAERMLDEGRVHILGSDAHGRRRRPPILGQGRDVAARRVGEQEATHLVSTRPAGVLANETPDKLPAPMNNPRGGHAYSTSSSSSPARASQRRAAANPDGAGLRGLVGRMQRIFR